MAKWIQQMPSCYSGTYRQKDLSSAIITNYVSHNQEMTENEYMHTWFIGVFVARTLNKNIWFSLVLRRFSVRLKFVAYSTFTKNLVQGPGDISGTESQQTMSRLVGQEFPKTKKLRPFQISGHGADWVNSFSTRFMYAAW